MKILDIFKDQKHQIQLLYFKPIVMPYFVIVLYTLLLLLSTLVPRS